MMNDGGISDSIKTHVDVRIFRDHSISGREVVKYHANEEQGYGNHRNYEVCEVRIVHIRIRNIEEVRIWRDEDQHSSNCKEKVSSHAQG